MECVIAQAMPFLKEQQALAEGRHKIDCFRLDFRITLASDNPELIVKECFNQHVRCFVGQGNQSEIELTVFQPQQQIVRQILTQCQ